MMPTVRSFACFAPIVALTCSGPLLRAESVSIGGPHRAGHARPPLRVNVTPATSASYTPSQIRHAYGVDQLSTTGSGQKIALVTAYGFRIRAYNSSGYSPYSNTATATTY